MSFVSLLRFIDKYFVGFLLFLTFFLKYIFVFKSKELTKSPKRILVIRLWALWSSLLTFPMIVQLKNYYKWIPIDLLCTNRNMSIFQKQWYFEYSYNLFKISDICKLIFNFKKYDIVIDTEEYFRVSTLFSLWLWKLNIWYSNIFIRKIWYLFAIKYDDKKHALITYLDLIKSLWINPIIPENMEPINFSDSDIQGVDDFMNVFNKKYFICFHTWWAETSKERFWAWDNWIVLVNLLISHYNKDLIIFFSWTKSESKQVENIFTKLDKDLVDKYIFNICWKFNIFEFSYFLKKMNLVISNDTGPMHLSAAMWTKTIWLFWPNLPERFWPYPSWKNIGLYKWDWKPFIDVHLWRFEAESGIWIVNKISPNEVLEKAINLLSFQ